MNLKTNIFLFLTIMLLSACQEEFYIPKPEGYHRIELPKNKYVTLQEKHPYRFEHSVYAEIKPHKSAISEKDWIDIEYTHFGASVQLTYKPLDEFTLEKQFEELIGDARKLTNKHNIKAYAIEETVIRTSNNMKAAVFELEGDVPSQFQFYATDTTNHFIRGALYFKTATKNDSLLPVIEYIKVDIIHLLNTLQWNSDINE